MKAAAAVAEILKREGVEFLIGYPVNPIIEAAAQADIRTIIVRQERTGLHMADAVSRVTSGRPDRRLRHAARARHRERVRRRGPGLRRLRADRRHAGRLPAAHRGTSRPTSTRRSTTARHQVGGAGDARRHQCRTRCGGPSPRSGTAARARSWSRFPSTSGTRTCRSRSTTSRRSRTRSAPDPGAVGRGRARARRGAAAGDLRGPGRALREGVAAAPPARRAARGAGHDEPAGQERVPREPPAVARLGRPVDPESTLHHFLTNVGRHLRHRLQLHADELRRGHAEGQDHHPRDARPRRPRQGHPDRSRRSSATPGSRSTRSSPR